MSFPDRLFHFTSFATAKKIIAQNRLKLSRIKSVNDPFEFHAIDCDGSHGAIIERHKTTWNDNTGFTCFSAKILHPLQWAHYADNHKGVALGFRVADDRRKYFKSVNYVSEALAWSDVVQDGSELRPNFLHIMSTTKFDAWSYEAEYRAFYALSHAQNEGGAYFVDFSSLGLALARVIFGCRANTRNRTAIQRLLVKNEHRLIVETVRPRHDRFEMLHPSVSW